MLHRLLTDDSGFIVSAEFVLIFTLMFCGVAVGTAVIRDSVVQEFGDIAEAIGALNQSYQYNSISAPSTGGNVALHASCGGSGFADQRDNCDCDPITFVVIAPKTDPQGNGTQNGIDGQNGNN